MPMTYLIFLATGSCFFSAHVGSELGRGLGFSGTAAEVIAARSHCKTRRRSGLQTLWLFSTDSGCSRLPLGRAAARAWCTKANLKQGGKNARVQGAEGACKARRRKPFKPQALYVFEEQPHPALDTLDMGLPCRPLGSPHSTTRSCCSRSPELHLRSTCCKAPPRLFASLSGGPLVFLFILTSLLYPFLPKVMYCRSLEACDIHSFSIAYKRGCILSHLSVKAYRLPGL